MLTYGCVRLAISSTVSVLAIFNAGSDLDLKNFETDNKFCSGGLDSGEVVSLADNK